jgi:hypothetical protein
MVALQNEVEGWRRLAQRLMTQGPMAGHILGGPTAELYLGRLPDHLPYSLPLPPDSRIVGSVADKTKASIYLDVDRSPDEVWQFYREHMQAPEWDIFEPDQPPTHGGFVPTMPRLGLVFCQGPANLGGPSLTVHARYGDAATEVMLLVANDPHWSSCPPEPEYYYRRRGSSGSVNARHRSGPMPHQRRQELLPPLRAPARAMMTGTGMGTWPLYQLSQADLETELDLGAVVDHFAAQLTRAGWTYRDGGQAGPVAFSTWTLQPETEEAGPGLLVALRTREGTPNRYLLFLRVGPP